MLKILIEILVQVFHDNNFFRLFFFSFSFSLIGFGIFYIALTAILRFSTRQRVCACLCFKGEGDIDLSLVNFFDCKGFYLGVFRLYYRLGKISSDALFTFHSLGSFFNLKFSLIFF